MQKRWLQYGLLALGAGLALCLVLGAGIFVGSPGDHGQIQAHWIHVVNSNPASPIGSSENFTGKLRGLGTSSKHSDVSPFERS
jgi:hypothetical protein